MIDLGEDLKGIQAESTVSSEQIDSLKQSTYLVLTDVDNQPSTTSVSALGMSVAMAYQDGEVTADELDRIQSSVTDVMISAGVSEESVEAMNESVDAIVSATGVDQEDIDLLVEDIQKIVIDLQTYLSP